MDGGTDGCVSESFKTFRYQYLELLQIFIPNLTLLYHCMHSFLLYPILLAFLITDLLPSWLTPKLVFLSH